MISDYEDSEDDEQEQPKVKRPLGIATSRNPNATQSMRQMPVTAPPERTIRKSKSAPMSKLNGTPPGNPNYAFPNQGAGFSPPQPPPPYMYSPPQYNPYSAPNSYYPMQQPTVIIRRNAPAMQTYGNYDQNFEGYFGPDVRPANHSALELQREQLQNFERTRPRRYYNNQQHPPAAASIQSAEQQALEEAIQASLLESTRRASHAGEGSFGTSGDFDSGYTSLATSSKSHHWNEDVLGENADPTALADEKALQEAILLSLTDSGSFDDAASPHRPVAPQGREQASQRTDSYIVPDAHPAAVADRQYPYNLSPQLRRESSFQATRSGEKVPSLLDRGMEASRSLTQQKAPAPEFHTPRTAESFATPRTAESFASPRTAEAVIMTARTAESALMSPRTDDELPERMDSRGNMHRKLSPREDYEQGYTSHGGGGRPVHLLRKDISERTSSTFSSGTTFHPADPRNRSSSTGRGSYAQPLPLPQDDRWARDPRSFERPHVSHHSGGPEKHHRRHRDFDHYPRGAYEESYDEVAGYRGAPPQRTRPPPPPYDFDPSASEREGRYRRDPRDAYAPHTDPIDRRGRAQRAEYAPEAPPQFQSRSSSAPRVGGRDRDPREFDRAPPAKYSQYQDRRAVY